MRLKHVQRLFAFFLFLLKRNMCIFKPKIKHCYNPIFSDNVICLDNSLFLVKYSSIDIEMEIAKPTKKTFYLPL